MSASCFFCVRQRLLPVTSISESLVGHLSRDVALHVAYSGAIVDRHRLPVRWRTVFCCHSLKDVRATLAGPKIWNDTKWSPKRLVTFLITVILYHRLKWHIIVFAKVKEAKLVYVLGRVQSIALQLAELHEIAKSNVHNNSISSVHRTCHFRPSALSPLICTSIQAWLISDVFTIIFSWHHEAHRSWT